MPEDDDDAVLIADDAFRDEGRKGSTAKNISTPD
jgi:hypothetical protein